MRIQHNIIAMNAYRNYSANTSAMQKNLERLSSGYKINRAGDDAAGLAISEKMRAQITGLEAASKNAKDGISLVQTAEGALTEVHDMLNRMVELATMSANGTYNSETDRTQLQKEVDQLKAEINRIADSANFNGIQLLDGSMDTSVISSTDTIFNGLVNSFDKVGGTDNGGLQLSNISGEATDNIQYHKDATSGGKTKFSFDFDNVNFEGTTGQEYGIVWGAWATRDDWGDETPSGGQLSFQMKDANGTLKNIQFTVSPDGAGKVSSEDIAKAIYDKLNEGDGYLYVQLLDEDGKALKDADENKVAIQYSVTLDGSELRFEMTTQGYNDAVDAVNNLGVAEADAFNGQFNIDWGENPNNSPNVGLTIKEGSHLGTNEIELGGIAAGAQMAYFVTYFDGNGGINDAKKFIKDGTGIQVGNEYYVWAMSDRTANAQYADNVKVVDLRNLLEDDGTFDYTKAENIAEALTRFTVAAKDNEVFDVQAGMDRNNLVFTERTTNNSGLDLTKSPKGLLTNIRFFTSTTSTTTVEKEAGEELTLQIGDTAASYNQLKVNIADCHVKALGIADVDISDQNTAAEAVDKIKDAINQVSDIRGTLGATQNRLDHTLNNLSVMTENIQDAESTIRDTDVAEEMMAYTKNNILIQAAQAMLAQANQIPQGVLQLLQ